MRDDKADCAMSPLWYIKVMHDHPHIERTDFRISRRYRRKLTRDHLLAKGLAGYFKMQRLFTDEIEKWNESIETGRPVERELLRKIKFALAEGVLKGDLETIDEDAYIGTCGQLIFKWIRAQYYGDKVLYSIPRLLTDSSKKQGADYFEILGDPTEPDSLYFIVWEIKATDTDVATRTDEIYQMHKKRTPRLLRGLEVQLSLEYPEDEYPVMGKFVRHLLDHGMCQ